MAKALLGDSSCWPYACSGSSYWMHFNHLSFYDRMHKMLKKHGTFFQGSFLHHRSSMDDLDAALKQLNQRGSRSKSSSLGWSRTATPPRSTVSMTSSRRDARV